MARAILTAASCAIILEADVGKLHRLEAREIEAAANVAETNNIPPTTA
jgi:hypothetical protein